MAYLGGTTTTLHREGESYPFDYKTPVHSVPYLPNMLPFPAAGGLNPYEPERASFPNPDPRFGSQLSVYVYDVLRELPEQSRGIDKTTLQNQLCWAGAFGQAVPAAQELNAGVRDCFIRGIHHDGTFAAFTPLSPSQRFHKLIDAGRIYLDAMDAAGPGEVVPLPPMEDARDVYFTLSAHERKRLRVVRRMPLIVARQLALKKNEKGQTPERRLLTLEGIPASDDLFRVVVSFL
jgi:hypothetical protein